MKPIKGFTHYQIDEQGNVYNTRTQRYLKPTINNIGYKIVSLSDGSKKGWFLLHRLIAQYHKPNPNNHPIVRHLNDIKTDNRLENLAWGTYSDNMKDRSRNGYKEPKRKLNEDQVKKIIKLKGELSQRKIAKLFNVSQRTILRIHKQQTYKEI